MREVKFLCLAVSRRDGGNCIAGIDIASEQLIRPVNAFNNGALAGSEILVADHRTQKRRMMKPLDLVSLPIGEHVGKRGQPENWTLVPAPVGRAHALLGDGRDDPLLLSKIKELARESASSGLLFGDNARSISHPAVQDGTSGPSLCIARPQALKWQWNLNYKGNPCIDALFELGSRNILHAIRLTDIVWETRLLNLRCKETLVKHSDLPEANEDSETYFMISLGDLFPQTGRHYKLIAGVLVLPRP